MFQTYEDIFGIRANSYQVAMDACPEARAAEFRAVIDPLGSGATGLVCDMPAGGGYLARYLPDQLHYLAVDPSDLFFAACPDGPGRQRLQAPLEAVPRSDGSVDHVVSLAGLHHVPDLGRVFGEMRRLVGPEGRVVIADVAIGSPVAIFLNGYVAENNPAGHDGLFFDDRTVGRLETAGLRVLEDRQVPVPWCFTDRIEAGAFCGALFGLVGPTPGEIADALEEIVGLREEDGRIWLQWSLRRLICTPA